MDIENSEVMKIVLKILKCHFIFVDFGIFETVFHLIQTNFLIYGLEHCDDILRTDVSFLITI